jgi:tetratricopeptide (TPR) repeat protein
VSAISATSTNCWQSARGALAQRAQSEQEGDLRPAIAIMEREVAALIARAGGRGNEAIAILDAATRAEIALPAPLGLPSPAKPAPELLGEMLLEAGRAREAQQSFEQALRRNANRSLSVLGLARAAAALGDGTTARRHYEQLLANYDRADADLPEFVEARTNLEPGRAPASTPARRAIPIALAISTLFAITVLWMRRKAVARRRIARKTDSRKTDSPSNKRLPKNRSGGV